MEHYGSGNMKSGDGLKLAVAYLQCAVKLNNQRLLVTKDPLSLLADKSLQGPCIEELAILMTTAANKSNNTTTTTAGNSNKHAQFTSDGLISGRDALALFSSLIRESDTIWVDGYEYDLQYDLHTALKRLSSTYASQCCLQQLPSKSVPPVVASNSIFVLWNPTVGKNTVLNKNSMKVLNHADGPESANKEESNANTTTGV